MSQKALQKNKRSLSPISHNGHSPYLSPKPVPLKQISQFNYQPGKSNICSPHQISKQCNQYSTVNQSQTRCVALQFSAQRKVKGKSPQLCFQNMVGNNNTNSSVKNNLNVANKNNSQQNYGQKSLVYANYTCVSQRKDSNNNTGQNQANFGKHQSNNKDNNTLSCFTANGREESSFFHIQRQKTQHDAKYSQIEIQRRINQQQAVKTKKLLQNEIRVLLDCQRWMQEEFESRWKNLEKEKNYWRQSYMQLKEKQQSQVYSKANLIRNASGQQIDTRNQFLNDAQQNLQDQQQLQMQQRLRLKIKQLQQKNERYLKTVMTVEQKIYNLNKQKAEMDFEMVFCKQENRKANIRILQLQQEVQNHRVQIKSSKQKVKKINEMDLSALTCHKSLEANSQADKHILLKSSLDQRQSEYELSVPMSPKHKSKSPGSFLHSSSLNGSSAPRHRSKHRSGSSSFHHSHSHSQHLGRDISQMQLHDITKQIQKCHHSYRKLQKTLANQNNQSIAQGLRKLNLKYEKLYQNQHTHQLIDEKKQQNGNISQKLNLYTKINYEPYKNNGQILFHLPSLQDINSKNGNKQNRQAHQILRLI